VTEEGTAAVENYWQSIVESISDGVWVLDGEWRCTYINDQQAKLLGIQPAEVVGKNVWELFPDLIDSNLYVELHRCIAEQQPANFEQFYPRGQHWLEFRAYPSAKGISIFTREITEPKQAEPALQENLERFRKIVEEAPVGVCVTDSQGKFLQANKTYCEMLGYSEPELCQLTFREITHPEDVKTDLRYVQQMFAREISSYQVEKRYLTKTGQTVWVHLTAKAVFDPQGQLRYGFAITENISARKQEERHQAAQYAVTRVLAEATTLVEAVPAILQALCESLDWQLGLIWSVERHENVLRYVNSWQAPTVDVQAFIQENQQRNFTPSVGLPGRIWASREPVWIAKLNVQSNFPRAASATKAGLKTVFGFPILLGQEILGVIECFSDRVQEPDANLLQMMAVVGSQIGQFMERKRAEAALQESQELFQSFMNHSPMSAFIKDETGRYIYVNSLVEQNLHRQQTDIVGKTDLELLPANIAQQFRANDLAMLASNEPLQILETLQIEEEERHYMSFKFPFRDASGRQLLAGVSIDVSDRIRAEAALRESQALYQTLAEAMPHLVWTMTPEGKLDYANQRWQETLGVTIEQINQSGWGITIHPDDLPRLLKDWQSILSGKSATETEYRHRMPNGTYRWFLGRTVVIQDQQGQFFRCLGSSTDIDQRKRAEEALRSSEERLALASVAAKIGTFEWNIQTNESFWTEEEEALYGLAPGSFGGKFQNWRQALHPDDRDRAEQDVLQAVADGKDLKTEFRILWPDGSVHWIAARGRVFYDRDGNPLRMIGVNEDISDRKQAELEREKILAREQRYANQLKGLNDAALAINSALSVEDVLQVITEQAYQIIGAHQSVTSMTVNDNWAQAINTVYLSDKYAQWRNYDAKTDGSGIYTYVCKMNQPMRMTQSELEAHFQWRAFGTEASNHPPLRGWLAAPLVGRDGQNIGLIQLSDKYEGEFTEEDEAIVMQLAQMASVAIENAQLYAAEQQARTQAETANRIKDEFLAVLSHELRSPLNPILGWTRLLRTRKFDQQATARALETIERNAKLQTELIEDLLDVSRILQGKMVLNVAPVNLANTIEAALETVRLAAEAKGIQIQTSLPQDVGFLSGDAARLQQVVWNLLSNAVKFTPKGGWVDIRLERVDTYAQIQVKDTGKGINPEFLPYVFDYFRQEDGKTTRTFGGLGLGLAIVRHLTELHGGTVQVESLGEGLGATFTVRLPLMSTVAETSDEHEPVAEIPDLSSWQILIVDDETDMRELLVAILESYGATVRVATSALEALSALEQFKPDVLISDIGMPEVDGYMLMRQVRRLTPKQGGLIPAIALTAYAGELNQQQALEAGFQKHLAKPVDPAELARTIAALV